MMKRTFLSAEDFRYRRQGSVSARLPTRGKTSVFQLQKRTRLSATKQVMNREISADSAVDPGKLPVICGRKVMTIMPKPNPETR